MQVGPAEIILILVVALLVFGPQRLPEVGRQVGAAVRELRRMQESIRGELDMVLHPEHGISSSVSSGNPDAELEPGDHTAEAEAEPMPELESGTPSANGTTPSDDDGRFLGPPDSFI